MMLLQWEATARRKREGTSVARAAPGASADGPREPGRFSARRKTEATVRLLRGEPLNTLARELGVTTAKLAQWREQFLTAGHAGLKSRQPDERDTEIQWLRSKLGEVRRAVPSLAGRPPPALRRSRA